MDGDDLKRIFAPFERQLRERQEAEDLRRFQRDLRIMKLESQDSLDPDEREELEKLLFQRQRESEELSIRAAAQREAWGFSAGRTRSDLPPESFPRRAEWLREQMKTRGHLTPSRLETLGGPNHRTIAKILRGEDVQDHVLSKLVAGLTAADPTQPIDLKHVPSN